MMQVSVQRERKRILNDLFKKPDKTGSTDSASASGCSRKDMMTQRSFFAQRRDRPVAVFLVGKSLNFFELVTQSS